MPINSLQPSSSSCSAIRHPAQLLLSLVQRPPLTPSILVPVLAVLCLCSPAFPLSRPCTFDVTATAKAGANLLWAFWALTRPGVGTNNMARAGCGGGGQKNNQDQWTERKPSLNCLKHAVMQIDHSSSAPLVLGGLQGTRDKLDRLTNNLTPSGQFRVTSHPEPAQRVFGPWEEAWASGENPRRQWGHANWTQKGRWVTLNLGPSRCKATALTATPPRRPSIYFPSKPEREPHGSMWCVRPQSTLFLEVLMRDWIEWNGFQ